MEKELLDLVSAEYASLGLIEKIAKAEGYSINSHNYIINFSKGKVLCKYLPNADAEKTLRILEISDFCRKNGARVPAVIGTDSGKMLNLHGNGVVYLLSFYEGEHFNGTVPEVSDFAKEAATLHKRLKRCPIEYVPKIDFSRYEHLSSEDLDSIVSDIKRKSGKHEFDEYVLEYVDFLKDRYKKNKAEGEKINRDKITIQYIHRDLHPGNVLFKNGKTEVILDLNSIAKLELVRDVAFACYRFALYNTKNADEMKKRKDAFIGSYMKSNPLTDEESGNMEYYFINECLNRISYILRSHYFENSTEWSFDLKKHIDNIKTAGMI